MRKLIIIGNWKMNNSPSDTRTFIKKFKDLAQGKDLSNVDYGIAAPYTSLHIFQEDGSIPFGAENVHEKDSGAFTGEISLNFLKETGVKFIIVGHSERREYFNETNTTINEKLHKILKEDDIYPIFAFGEQLEHRQEGKTMDVISWQLVTGLKNITSKDVKKIVFAYEPIWAIGTGVTATPEQAQETILNIRNKLAEIYDSETANEIRIQYGGSVKPNNVKELMSQPDIDGALVGGSSVKASDFIQLLTFEK